MTLRKFVFYIAVFLLPYVVSSCNKDVLRHGIKGKVIYKNSDQPYANGYVDVSYYAPSCGMGILTKCGTVGKGYTDGDGTFKIMFSVKGFHLEEGDFSIRVAQNTIISPVAEVGHDDLREKRIVNAGTIEIEP